ncbi:5455_t:CDS:2 [Paraglomus brasilianum]|uniref:5455_t:CDS:1 n=1 Tax=Paraglomus brasilianum TaxID=144538 RepID=A0A9N8VH45_9GLOM|nr:5455_t:CDS:2 [Paraglomus brasilianum]
MNSKAMLEWIRDHPETKPSIPRESNAPQQDGKPITEIAKPYNDARTVPEDVELKGK